MSEDPRIEAAAKVLFEKIGDVADIFVCINLAHSVLAAADAAAWRSMESAPKDGARFLSAIEGVDRAVSIYWNGAEWLTVDGNDWRGREIYAWQHLPTPPQEPE